MSTSPGKGTTFRLSFPRAVRRKASPVQPTACAPSRPLQVLVVDDDPLVVDFLAEALRRDGHTVQTANNGPEGLQAFHSSRFHLVITDKAMPEINGDRLASSIQRVAPDKPIIMLTGFGDLISSDRKPVGVDLVLTKPVGTEELHTAISRVMGWKAEVSGESGQVREQEHGQPFRETPT